MLQSEKHSFTALGIFHLFIGLGGLGGGFGAIMSPSGEAMGISTDVLRNAPFDDFLIPGIFLFAVVGLGNVLAAVSAWRGFRYQGYITGVLSAIMVLWIIVQVYMLWAINVLHVVYFFIGAIGLVWAVLLSAKQKLWPFSVLGDWHKVSDA